MGKIIDNWIAGQSCPPLRQQRLKKYNPHTGELLSELADSSAEDVVAAVDAAGEAFSVWANLTPVQRGRSLMAVAALMKERAEELADLVAVETGKPPADALGEVGGAILQAEYFAGEGQRFHGRSLTSGTSGKYSHTVRQPLGVAALIVPANTPIANIAWKIFPALICGNAVVLKASEDAPETADRLARLTREAGLSDGILNVIQGGPQAGAALVDNPKVTLISFTGSTSVGRIIAEKAGRRLARVSLELGGKNPLVICDDADLEKAVHWASLSAFSNAGQRCAAASRLIIFEKIYDRFKAEFVAKTAELKLGVAPGCDLGPVINRRQQENILKAIDKAIGQGGRLLCGGAAPDEAVLRRGFYVLPTVIENLVPEADLSRREVFGPLTVLYKVKDLNEALKLANGTDYGLSASIHTRSVDRAMWFAQRVRAGVANVNLGTFGSEPHMPFGGFGCSGNGTREPGPEALDVYSELKNISFLVREELI